MPSYAFEATDYAPDSLKGQGILSGFGATPPDRFLIARWRAIKNTYWDYEIKPGQPLGDSSVALYWDPKDIAPGETTTYVTYCGLAGASGGQAWIDAPVSVTNQAPELQATLRVSNKSDSDFTGGQAALALPPGLKLAANEQALKPMPRVPASGGAQSVTWQLVAAGDINWDDVYAATVTYAQGSGPLSASARLSYRFIAPGQPTVPAATPPAGPTVAAPPAAIPPPRSQAPLWPLVLIPLLGFPLLWLLLCRRQERRAAAVPPPASGPRPARPIVLDQPAPHARPAGSDVTHGRRKPPGPE